MKPRRPAIPARGVPAMIQIPLRETARPVDERTAALNLVRVDDV